MSEQYDILIGQDPSGQWAWNVRQTNFTDTFVPVDMGFAATVDDAFARAKIAVRRHRAPVHKAESRGDVRDFGDRISCRHCDAPINRVPGGQGSTWVHTATGAVAASGAPR